MSGRDEILAERSRQVNEEGYSRENDLRYRDGQLMEAGFAYMMHGLPGAGAIGSGGCPQRWPWPPSAWKPKSRRQNLVRAGALFLAEIDRLEPTGGLPGDVGMIKRWVRQCAFAVDCIDAVLAELGVRP